MSGFILRPISIHSVALLHNRSTFQQFIINLKVAVDDEYFANS